jgi:antitoxin (DNA-binding transcriptional repressor) of toxin-antitoxin stability system
LTIASIQRLTAGVTLDRVAVDEAIAKAVLYNFILPIERVPLLIIVFYAERSRTIGKICNDWEQNGVLTESIGSMLKISVEEATGQLRALLERVARGEEVILVEQDREVARLIPPPSREQWLTHARQFRESLPVQGESLSTTVIRVRQEERG